ncbi:tenascin-like [Pomacea canaliculata]|uniref:tenascin-like n=1 Tax=Pomacea canaliculata TaxID=400727 RepID=UPI000D72ECD5|nr:tenascin-like [Pomacea canaliculata]
MLRFFVFLLWVSPCVLTKATGRCQGEVCDVKTWHNVSCRTDDDCNQTHAVCDQHLCRCEAGYFYTTPYDICSGTCSTGELQDSFTEYPDSALRRHYLDRQDGLSLEDCKGRCLTDTRCLTFDFRVIEGQCRLHAVTSRGSPSHWYPKTSTGWTHYQRTCNSTLATHHTWYNSLCNTKVDCPDPNSDCLSHRCLCRSGFKFIETEKECVVASVWHNVSCRTDDDCNQTHAVCYQHLCRCEAGYFYTTPYDICSGTCSTGELQDSFTEYPDSALRRHYLDRRDGLSLEDCKGRCQDDKRCLTFDFRVIEGQCRLHNVTSYESPSYWYPKTSTGWTHYQRTCKSTLGSPDDWYNSLCNTIVDCRDTNSDCLSHRCLCRSGFKFNETEKKCVVTSVWHNVSCRTDDDCNQTHAVCYQHLCRCEAGFFYTTPYDICSGTCSTGELQDSFTEYPDSALRRHYLDRRDGLSLEDCKGRCQTNKRCLTFDFRVIEDQCRLHNVTSYESPSDWYPKTSKGWTHYQRTCKSTLGSPDDWYNSLCNTKEDCRDPNSDCLSHRCLCRSGFKFIETEKECVVARSCLDWQDKGAKSGVYTIQLIASSKPRSVWCDMDTAGGGWTVIHRRRDFSVDFNRNWTEYVNGFGDISGDYWLGLSAIHEQIRYKSWSLRVDIVDGSGERRYAQYGWFRLDGPEYNYKLSWYWYWGDAGDDLTPSYDKEFSTYDRDPTGCVRARHSAWWYPDDCGRTYLNSPSASGNVWGDYSNLQFSEMKLRPYESTLGLTPAP